MAIAVVGLAELLSAAGNRALVRFLAGVHERVSLEVSLVRKGFPADFTLHFNLTRVI